MRLADPSDLDALCALERTCYPDAWPKYMYRQELAKARAFMIVFAHKGSDRIVGLSMFTIRASRASLDNLMVHPSLRGVGAGRLLLRLTLRVLDSCGVERVTLAVRRSNPARKLYITAGFTPVRHLRRFYFRPIEDALLMARKVPQCCRIL